MPVLGIIASQISGHLFAPSGAYDSIATTTLSSSQTTITFSSIPSTYTHLQLRVFGKVNTGVDSGYLRFNSDSATNYSWHRLAGSGSSVNASAGTSTAQIVLLSDSGYPAATSTFGVSVIDILDYADTNKYKTVRSLGGYDANGSGGIALESGSWRSTSAISTITFAPSSYSWQQYSSFALYGIKGA